MSSPTTFGNLVAGSLLPQAERGSAHYVIKLPPPCKKITPPLGVSYHPPQKRFLENPDIRSVNKTDVWKIGWGVLQDDTTFSFWFVEPTLFHHTIFILRNLYKTFPTNKLFLLLPNQITKYQFSMFSSTQGGLGDFQLLSVTSHGFLTVALSLLGLLSDDDSPSTVK